MVSRAGLFVTGCIAAAFMIAAMPKLASGQQKVSTSSESGLAALAAVAPVSDCGGLVSADLSAVVGAPTKVISAVPVPDGKPAPYCDVKGNIDPHVGFEVRLPLAGWTQRSVQTGCGGYCGSLSPRLNNTDGCEPATNGELAIVSTDMGREGGMNDADYFATHYDARIDFAYRGQHLTHVAAKALIKKYYGQAAKFSYFSGCSDGGREALMEAQRFPDDFDGIIAGAPASMFVTQNTYFWQWSVFGNTGADGKPILTADKLPILHQAVLDQCDALDGLKDGLISDPLGCHPDFSTIQCKPGQDPATCVTPAQIKVALGVYSGAHDSEGNRLFPGGIMPGSEMYWGGSFAKPAGTDLTGTAGVAGMANGTYKYLAFEKNPPVDSTSKDLKFTKAEFAEITKLRGLYDATDADLKPFASHGGKLIMFHGTYDGGMSPYNTILYYMEIEKIMGKTAAENFARLYIFPGGYHCSGGEGPFRVGLLYPLMAWVEKGHAPNMLVASHVPSDTRKPGAPRAPAPAAAPNAAAVRDALQPQSPAPTEAAPDIIRPVFPYPMIAKYKGAGDTNDPKNFTAVASPAPASLANWLGSSFYTPGYQLWCTGNETSIKCEKKP